MAERIRKNKKRREKEEQEKLALLVRTALDDGFTNKNSIAKACEIKLWKLNDFFAKNKELHALYVIRRKTLVDKAADNIEEIVNDKDHPQHFQASKYVLQNYKSDLDVVLESHNEEKIEVEIPQSATGAEPIMIKFAKSSKKED